MFACMQMYLYPFLRIFGDVHQHIVHVGLFEEFVNSLVNIEFWLTCSGSKVLV